MARYHPTDINPDAGRHDCTGCFSNIRKNQEMVEDSEGQLWHAECLPKANPEACPGCGCVPGDGVMEDCDDENGCGFFKAVEATAN